MKHFLTEEVKKKVADFQLGKIVGRMAPPDKHFLTETYIFLKSQVSKRGGGGRRGRRPAASLDPSERWG